MPEEIHQQLYVLFETIDTEIKNELSEIGQSTLTLSLSKIHSKLWESYKEVFGISTGFYGIDEYLIFSCIKCFIEKLNPPSKFQCKGLADSIDIRFFELEKENRSILLYHSSNLRHFPNKAKHQLFFSKKKFRAPDISILKRVNNEFELVAIVEIKNFLDKSSTENAIKLLTEIREDARCEGTKYVLFSFGKISVKDKKVLEDLRSYVALKNNYLIAMKRTNEEFKIVDLAELLFDIKGSVSL